MSLLDEEMDPIDDEDESESDKLYIFTKEVRRWGVEAGDYYHPGRHMIQGGTEKLLLDGIIEEEIQE